MTKAREAQKPKIVFDNKFYRISIIPLNYRIDVKRTLIKKIPNHGIDRDCYSDLDKGLKEAQAVARMVIDRHFTPTPAMLGQEIYPLT